MNSLGPFPGGVHDSLRSTVVPPVWLSMGAFAAQIQGLQKEKEVMTTEETPATLGQSTVLLTTDYGK